jgi:hypothetical protein
MCNDHLSLTDTLGARPTIDQVLDAYECEESHELLLDLRGPLSTRHCFWVRDLVGERPQRHVDPLRHYEDLFETWPIASSWTGTLDASFWDRP